MAYQSLYRRFRPQRFDEVLGQDHVAMSLRNAVRHDRVGHAYLFSGPRGTGKTSTARILAKALNCTDLRDGEPCGECDSCRSVVAGTSMDVHELDAASNNGVDAMRDLVARTALGTAGRRKVYIVDEVHMLSTAASNALLKTLEEPPDHVVFVLATTDPQKVLPTIRSRTQPFEFKLLSHALLVDHLRDIAGRAGASFDDAVFDTVARKANGSARDGLSALDQAIAAGGVDDAVPELDDLLEGLANGDGAHVLLAVDRAVSRGRDPRQLARDLVERLRAVFLQSMAPDLVDAAHAASAPAWAGRLGAAATTRALEAVGEALVAMRDSIEPRVNLEVVLLRLARAELDTSPAALLQRIAALEDALWRGALAAPAPTVAPAAPPAESVAAAPSATPAAPVAPFAKPAPSPAEAVRPTGTLAPPPAPASATAAAAAPRSGAADAARARLASVKGGPGTGATAKGAGTPRSRAAAPASPAPSGADAPADGGAETSLWDAVLEELRGTANRARVLFASGRIIEQTDDAITVGLPNDMHRGRCEEHLPVVTAAFEKRLGRPIAVRLGVDPRAGAEVGGEPAEPSDDEPPAGRAGAAHSAPARAALAAAPPPQAGGVAPASAHAGGVRHDDAHDEIDLHDLQDATDVPVHSTTDEVLRAFPGAELVGPES